MTAEAPRTPNLPQIAEIIDNTDSEKRKTGKDKEGPDFQGESIARINLDSALNNNMENTSNTGAIPRGNLNMHLENSQKKECGCESTVLIVDDNFFNLVPLELILRETYQLQVDKAQNGLEAVNKFRLDLNKKCCNIRYRMVLMDLNMPVMDGYRATEIILQLHAQFL
jgi:PleD family two-component response regulator